MEQQSAKTVFVVDSENKVALRTVTLGDRFENLIIVKEGVKPGERVIAEGAKCAERWRPWNAGKCLHR